MYKIFWLLFAVAPLNGFCQVTDDFSDGDFTTNPIWLADNSSHWTVSSGQLRSNSLTPSSTFYITTASAIAAETQWNFTVHLLFNTSSANYVDVYLMSEQSDLMSASNNGYFVRIGGTSDEVSFWKLTAGAPSLLIDGVNGLTNTSNNRMRISVTRDASNQWTLQRDLGITGTYFTEGTVTDATFLSTAFFGIRITQSTSTFHTKHYFDDFFIGRLVTDTSPPSIVSVTPISDKELEVFFSEKIEHLSAESFTNYSVDKGVGSAMEALLQEDERTVRLLFSNNFPNADTGRLTVSNVEDLLGNKLLLEEMKFFSFRPVSALSKDLIFSEIFADPSPSVGLPEAEFVEIYNRSAKAFDLAGWKFADATVEKVLPTKIIFPGDYVLLVNSSLSSAYANFTNVVPVIGFPTLNNTGESIVLYDSDNTRIDSVNFKPDWYRNEEKADGGWSLELIDTENGCGEEGNWTASENEVGGTPGKENSVKASKPDTTPPQLLSVIPENDRSLLLLFNEKLEKALPAITAFKLTPSIPVNDVVFTSTSLTELKLSFESALETRMLYELQLNEIYDCAGNEIDKEAARQTFALPEVASVGDIFLNEILFNPRTSGADFVEVYNHSSKFINLKELRLANRVNEILMNEKSFTGEDAMLYPNTYLVFTPGADNVKGEYPQAAHDRFFEMETPPMNDEEGSMVLLTAEGLVIDELFYSRNMHSVLLKDEEGASLERVSLEESALMKNNWRSGVAATHFATPGYKNANSQTNSIGQEEVRVEPEIFEPLIGQPNFTSIQYHFDKGGLIANAKILDAQGRLVKSLTNNEILGTEGFFTWDGDQDDGARARIGYYTLWMEVFDTSGFVKTFRKRIIIASRF